MDGASAGVREQITAAAEQLRAAHQAITAALTLVRGTEATEREIGPVLLEAAELVGRSGQAHEGELVQLLAEAHRFKAGWGGVVPWIVTHLNVTESAARGIARSAREIGHLPELSESLSSGSVGSGTIRALTRTAVAVKDTEQNLTTALGETLHLATTGSVTEANRHVRVLEETIDPGSAEELLAKQRRRSFVRITDCESGMTRIEALLDPERATTVRAAIEATVAARLRERQYDGGEVPAEMRSVEQLQAHALTRFAEVYLSAGPEQRGASFTASILFSAPMDETQDAGLATSVHGHLIPRTRLAPLGHPAAHLLEHRDGQPLILDGEPVDKNPAARLASPAQRIALAWRDRHCTFPGCARPPTFSLHAHHQRPYRENGPSIMGNFVSLCAEHHSLIHHPRT